MSLTMSWREEEEEEEEEGEEEEEEGGGQGRTTRVTFQAAASATASFPIIPFLLSLTSSSCGCC